MTASLEMGEDEVPFIKIGDEILRLDLEELDQEIAEKARIELRETPEIVEESLEILKTLLKGNPGIFRNIFPKRNFYCRRSSS